MSAKEKETIIVRNPKIRVINPNFCVGQGAREDGSLLKLKGKASVLGKVSADFSYELSGRLVENADYGTQLEVSEAQLIEEASIEWQKKYLASGVFPGLGPVEARLIVDHFGSDSKRILESSPERISEVNGIDETRREALKGKFIKGAGAAFFKQALESIGIAPFVASRIASQVEVVSVAQAKDALEKISKDPFKECEKMGLSYKDLLPLWEYSHNGAEPEHRDELMVARAKAAIMNIFSSGQLNGSEGVPLEDLGKSLEIYYGVPISASRVAYKAMLNDASVVEIPSQSGKIVFEAQAFERAKRIALRFKEKLYYGSTPFQYLNDKSIEALINSVELYTHSGQRIEMEPAQKDAVRMALTNPASIITGGPGTGKTTIMRVIVEIFGRRDYNSLVAAFTGKASKRAAESFAGLPLVSVETLHKTFGYKGEGEFEINASNPLTSNLLLVDESSFNDPELTEVLISGISDDTSIVLIGDQNQLPSINPGAVFRDFLSSQALPSTKLTTTKRSSGPILKAIEAVGRGEMFDQAVSPDGNFRPCAISFADYDKGVQDTKEAIVRNIQYAVQERGFHPNDVQVYLPEKEGDISCASINLLCQSVLNPNGTPLGIDLGGELKFSLRAGDRVMEQDNDKEKDVRNGEIGYAKEYDQLTRTLYVDYPDKVEPVKYVGSEIRRLQAGYAVTIHKSQGSENRCVITAFVPKRNTLGDGKQTISYKRQHLERALLFTGLSRAKEILVPIYESKTIAHTLSNEASKKRITALSIVLADPDLQPTRRPKKINPPEVQRKTLTMG